MGVVILLRVFWILAGLIVFILTTVSLAKKQMTESFCIFWGIISVLLMICGIVLRPVELSRYISWSGIVIICLGVLCLLISGFYFSVRISRLIRQTTELAIQVSLLNQENEILLRQLAMQEAVIDYGETHEEKNPVYN